MSFFCWTRTKEIEEKQRVAALRARVTLLEEQRDAYGRIIEKLQKRLLEEVKK